MAYIPISSLTLQQVHTFAPGTLVLPTAGDSDPGLTFEIMGEDDDSAAWIVEMSESRGQRFRTFELTPPSHPCLSIQKWELLVDRHSVLSPTRNDAHAGFAWIDREGSGLIVNKGYGTAFVSTKGIFQQGKNTEHLCYFASWKLVTETMGGEWVTIHEHSSEVERR